MGARAFTVMAAMDIEYILLRHVYYFLSFVVPGKVVLVDDPHVVLDIVTRCGIAGILQ